MDDVKGKVKDFMKNPFSSSSGKFKGQGRVLGSSSSSSDPSISGAAHPLVSRLSAPAAPPKHRRPISKPSSSPPPPSDRPARAPAPAPAPAPATSASAHGFSPFDPLISSGNRAPSAPSPSFQCPICSRSFASETETTAHVDDCLAGAAQSDLPATSPPIAHFTDDADPGGGGGGGGDDNTAIHIAAYLSGPPPPGAVEVVSRLLGNVAQDPGNTKFRKVRMGNPKIKEAIGDVPGGVQLLEYVGFRCEEEGGEVWATIGVPSDEELCRIRRVLETLQRDNGVCAAPPPPPPAVTAMMESNEGITDKPVELKRMDRQVRVYFSIPGKVPEQMDLPDSFYKLSAQEIKQEYESKKKKLADSQLLVPKSYKEKQMKAARKKYRASVIRIHFPDGVILQGVFLPSEQTVALYEFVSSSLKDPSLEFELLQPGMGRPQVICRLPKPGSKPPTLEDEDLVPSAVIKFKPKETDSVVFTGLRNELLEASEPLTSAVPPIMF